MGQDKGYRITLHNGAIRMVGDLGTLRTLLSAGVVGATDQAADPDGRVSTVGEMLGIQVATQTIYCRTCRAELPGNTLYCPECGRNPTENPLADDERRRARWGLFLRFQRLTETLIAAGFVLVACLAGFVIWKTANIQRWAIRSAPPPGAVITQDEFDRIRTGMSYDETAQVVGDPGTKVGERDQDGQRLITFEWTNGPLSSAIVVFSDGRVSQKTQVGLP